MKIEWSAFAFDDRNIIFDYIEQDSPQAAIVVDDRISEQVSMLTQFPEAGRAGRVTGTRELVTSNTHFLAVDRIADETVEILRILHSAQQWPDDF